MPTSKQIETLLSKLKKRIDDVSSRIEDVKWEDVKSPLKSNL